MTSSKACLCALALLLSCMTAASLAGESSLQWGRSQSPCEDASVGQTLPQARVMHDVNVVVAAWEEADAAPADSELPEVEYVADGRSVVVKRSIIVDDAEFDSPAMPPTFPDRFAQLPSDPFETDDSADLFEESLPAPEPQMEEVEDAVVEEMDRRDGAEDYDLFDDPAIAQPAKETLQGKSPLEGSSEIDVTPTIDADSTDLEPADTRLFDEMTSDGENLKRNSTDESTQFGRESLDLDLSQPSSDRFTEEQRRLLEIERVENKKSCQEELDKLRAQRLESIDLSIRVTGNAGEDYPFECSLEGEQLAPREWPQITYMWKASGLCHKPLYFEQVALERYGHSWGPYTQPIMSGVHFFGTLPILPYKMGLQTPNECVYSLGYYRPGNCAPYLVGGVPFTWRAAGYQMGVATGLSFIFP